MKRILLVTFFLISMPNIWAQQIRDSISPEERKLSDELKRDQEYKQISCERQAANATDRDKASKLKALEAFKKESEKSKLKKTCGTIEGDPIFSYLAVENGKASIFVDTLHDKFGSKRVYSYQCSELDIGIYFNDLKGGRMVFRKVEAAEARGEQIFLRCISGEKELIF